MQNIKKELILESLTNEIDSNLSSRKMIEFVEKNIEIINIRILIKYLIYSMRLKYGTVDTKNFVESRMHLLDIENLPHTKCMYKLKSELSLVLAEEENCFKLKTFLKYLSTIKD